MEDNKKCREEACAKKDELEEPKGRGVLEGSTDNDLSVSEYLILKSSSLSHRLVTQRLS